MSLQKLLMSRRGLRRRLSPRLTIGLVVATFLVACSTLVEVRNRDVAARPAEVCIACALYMGGRQGPKAQAYLMGDDGVRRFASTRDFFAYITHGDIASRLEAGYVQDTARIDWAHPTDAPRTFIDARKAYYVAWQPLPGETGPTLASFATRSDAKAFVRSHGGAILRFGQISSRLVWNLDYSCPGPKSPMSALTSRARCVLAPDARGRIRVWRAR